MEPFRNIRVTTRFIVVNLLLLLLAVGVFLYIKAVDLSIHLQVYLFLSGVFLFLSILTNYFLARSVIRPIQRIRKRLRGFLERKVATPVKDFGSDEFAGLADEVNRIFTMWNAELVTLMKKQKQAQETTTKVETQRSSLDVQLAWSRSCLQIAQQLNTTFDFQTNLKCLLDEAVKTLNLQWASILLINRDNLELNVACVRGREQSLLDDLADDEYPAIKLKPNEGLAGQVIKEGLPLIANKGHRDPRFKFYADFPSREEKIASILCAPIKGQNDTILGVINFVNRVHPPFFLPTDVQYAEDIAILASIVIERHRMFRNLFRDDSTGLLGFNVWKGYFEEEASRSVRYAQPLSLMLLDLDNFKQIIDHADQAFSLKVSAEIGQVLRRLLRETDLGSRVQDRFYLLLPNTDPAGAVFLSGRIQEALEPLVFEFQSKSFRLTASAGIASYPDNTHDARLLMRNAGKALNQAKEKGKNRVVIYGADKKAASPTQE